MSQGKDQVSPWIIQAHPLPAGAGGKWKVDIDILPPSNMNNPKGLDIILSEGRAKSMIKRSIFRLLLNEDKGLERRTHA